MIKITNGIDVFEVTNGAYKGIYSKQGFKPVKKGGAKKAEKKVDPDEEFVKEVEEKPISGWSKADIKKYAKIFGIDISKTKSIDDAREIIQAFIDEKQED